MGIVPAASLNVNGITNVPGVTACIAVSTAPLLPPTIVHSLAPTTPSRQGLALVPASFPPSIVPHSALSPPSSVSSPSSSAFLNSTVIAPPLLVSSSPASYTPSPLSATRPPLRRPVPVPSVPPLPSPAAIFPLSISALTSELKGHPSTYFRQYLQSGFRHCFRIGFSP